MLKLKIKKHDPKMPDLEKYGDWIDLRFCGIHPKSPNKFHKWDIQGDRYCFYAGDYFILSLGISVELPPGYEAYIMPRSSTFKKFGILYANSCGIIDNNYCGDNDIWGFPAYFTRPTSIKLYSRIAQFRIQRNMPPVYLVYVDQLNNSNRGGFGQSGNF